MGNLALAGVVSGMGQGLQQGLAQMNSGIVQMGLHDADREFQTEKLKLQMEHAERLQAKTEAGAERRLAISEGGAEARQGKSLASSEKIHSEEIASREGISKSTLENAKEMNAATNATHLLTAKLQRQMQEKQFDKTFTQAKLSALKDTVRELGNEITRLSVVVSNPLADKTDPSYKSAVIQLESATKLHNLYAKQVGLEMNIDESTIDKSINKPALPPFKMPSSGGPTAPSQAPGLMQTPAP